MNKPTVTVAIPAYNEENGISNILNDVIKQVQQMFVLEEIIVYSDGSSDDTVKIAQLTFDNRIRVIRGRKNLGKPARINMIFKLVNTDICVILDADIRLRGRFAINKLVFPMVADTGVMLTYGKLKPFQPRNSLQRILYKGSEIWDTAISYGKSEMYSCEGPVRAFRKRLYKQIKFPRSSAEDVYPYLYCSTRGMQTKRINAVLAYYRLPSTFGDYVKQYSRFAKSPLIHRRNFGSKVVAEYFSVGFFEKTKAVIHSFSKDKRDTAAYLFVWTLAFLVTALSEQRIDGIWEIAHSTKKE